MSIIAFNSTAAHLENTITLAPVSFVKNNAAMYSGASLAIFNDPLNIKKRYLTMSAGVCVNDKIIFRVVMDSSCIRRCRL